MAENDDQVTTDARGPMLAFYIGKSTSHASFVVAGVFGLYSLLRLFTYNLWQWWVLAYIALFLINLYSFANFAYYGKLADILRGDLDKDKRITEIINRVEVKGPFQYIRRFKIGFMDKMEWRKYLIFASLWIISTFVPLIARLLTLTCTSLP
jgi:hypothetical protein